MRTDRWTHMISPIYIHFMHIIERTHNKQICGVLNVNNRVFKICSQKMCFIIYAMIERSIKLLTFMSLGFPVEFQWTRFASTLPYC